MYHKYIIFPPT